MQLKAFEVQYKVNDKFEKDLVIAKDMVRALIKFEKEKYSKGKDVIIFSIVDGFTNFIMDEYDE